MFEEEKPKRKQPVLKIEALAVLGNATEKEHKFLKSTLHKKYTMKEMKQAYEDNNLRIGDSPYPRDEISQQNLSYCGVYRPIFGESGDEIPGFEINSEQWKNSYIAEMTVMKID